MLTYLKSLTVVTVILCAASCSSGNSNSGYGGNYTGGYSSRSSNDYGGSSSSSSSSAVSVKTQLVQGRDHFDRMCAGCHGNDGRGGSAVGLTIADRSLANLTQFINDNMPRGNATACVAGCASATALYVQSLFEPATPAQSLSEKISSLGSILSADGRAYVLTADDSNNLSVKEWILNDRSLYVFKNDLALQSNCVSGTCINNWPPLLAGELSTVAAPWSTFKREDGTWQWAYEQQPIYLFAQDQNPEDILGQGLNDLWFVIELAQ